MRFDGFVIAVEEKGDAPKSRKRNDNIIDASENGSGAARAPRDAIKGKQTAQGGTILTSIYR